MWHSATMTEIGTVTEIGIETGTAIEIAIEIEIEIEIEIAIEIAATTIIGLIATGTAMTGVTWTGTGETTGDMIAAMTATTGAGMEDAGFTGMAGTGFTKTAFLNEVSSF
jgi:hypothetical protein